VTFDGRLRCASRRSKADAPVKIRKRTGLRDRIEPQGETLGHCVGIGTSREYTRAPRRIRPTQQEIWARLIVKSTSGSFSNYQGNLTLMVEIIRQLDFSSHAWRAYARFCSMASMIQGIDTAVPDPAGLIPEVVPVPAQPAVAKSPGWP
jgi:hypothetical protein